MPERHQIESIAYNRAHKYITKVPGAVQGESGDTKTFALVCTLTNGFLLDDKATLGVLKVWNQTCQPPWSLDDLKHKIQEAHKCPPPNGKEYGWMLTRKNSGNPAESPVSCEESSSPKPPETNITSGHPEQPHLLFDAEPDDDRIKEWARSKKPIELFSVQAFFGETANYLPKPVSCPNWYQRVIVIPMFDLAGHVTGRILHLVNGKEFGKNKQRFMITSGSKGGLVCNPNFLALLHKEECPVKWIVRVEGVSDALALYSHIPEEIEREYLVVTSGCGGGQGVDKPPFSDLIALAAKKDIQVVVVGDNDSTGSLGADKWCCGALNAGCRTLRSELPEAHHNQNIKDVRDFLRAGGDWEDIIQSFASPWEKSDHRTRRPVLINPTEVEEKETRWLWENKIPAGTISMLVGPQGTGKTFLTTYMASVITRNGMWADETPCEQGSVLFFYGEDGIESVYKPRLRANGADQSKIRFFDGIKSIKNGVEVDEPLSIKSVDEIRAAIEDTAKATGFPVRLVVIDPISNYWNGVKENDNAEVRSALRPIQRLAEETDVAFLLISHVGKTDHNSAVQRVLGSTALTAVARSVWVLYPDAERKGHIYFAPSKNNLAVNPTSVEFYINRDEGGRVDVVNAMIDKTADDFEHERRTMKKRGRVPVAFDAAKKWLMQFLGDGPKPAGKRNHPESDTIYGEALNAGHSLRTIDRVKKEIGVCIRKRDDGLSEWCIPGCIVPMPEPEQETQQGRGLHGSSRGPADVPKIVPLKRNSTDVPKHSGAPKHRLRQKDSHTPISGTPARKTVTK